ncbi:MAG: hypothetical protein ABSH53_03245 [Holophaga sp.]
MLGEHGRQETLRDDLKALLRAIGIPTIFVTHDQTEAQVLAGQVAVMRSGKLVQVGTPDEVFNRPVDRFVASFVGVENILEGSISRIRDGLVQVELPEGPTMPGRASGPKLSTSWIVQCWNPIRIPYRMLLRC